MNNNTKRGIILTMSNHEPGSFDDRYRQEFELFEKDVSGTETILTEAIGSEQVSSEVVHANRHELLMASPGFLLANLGLHDSVEIITDSPPDSEQAGRLYVELLPWHNQTTIASDEAVRARVLSSNLPELHQNAQVSINGACIEDYMPQNGIIRRDCNLMLTRISMIPLAEVLQAQAEPTPGYIDRMLETGAWERDRKTGQIYVLSGGNPVITPPVTAMHRREVGSAKEVQLEWQPASSFNPEA